MQLLTFQLYITFQVRLHYAKYIKETVMPSIQYWFDLTSIALLWPHKPDFDDCFSWDCENENLTTFHLYDANSLVLLVFFNL